MEAIDIIPEPTADEVKAAAREKWVDGSIPQLRLKWSGRCLTCAAWEPPTGKEKLGACSWLGSDAAQDLIQIGHDLPVLTAPEAGCIGWAEITPVLTEIKTVINRGRGVDPEVRVAHKELSGPIRARVEHAITAALMDDVPADEA